jgi:predicted amidohydrolase YtcJ
MPNERPQQRESIVFSNGRIHTCGSQRDAAWVWIERDKIAAVGSGTPPEPDGARRYDLRGRSLTPGFCDAHVHLTWVALSLLGPDVSRCDSPESVCAAIAAWDGGGRGPGDAWIVGDGFDESTWTHKRLPTRDELDAVDSVRPVLVKRVCGHVGVVNSPALEALRVGKLTDRASGRIAESDLWALNDRLRPGPEALARVVPRVTQLLHQHGVTAVHDVTSVEMLRALQSIRARDRLELRVSCSLPTDRMGALRDSGLQAGFGDEWLRVLGIKLFVDGSLGAHTAFLRQPYSDAPDTRGVPLYEADALRDLLREGHDAGLQLMIHAIGDATLERVLDCVEPLTRSGNPLRRRLEHVEITPDDLVSRLADSALWACVQPNFAGRWSHPGGLNQQRLGDTRLGYCNAYRSLLDAGVPLAFGSDCMPVGPAFGLHSAVHHPIEAQRLTPQAALELYTAAAAECVHARERFGRIEPGMAADLVVLDADPLDPAQLADARVAATFVAGRRVHEREAAAPSPA